MSKKNKRPVPDQPAPDSLDAVLTDVWQHLTQAAQRAKHGFHLPVLCTQPLDASQPPQARTVVLRHADANLQTIAAHTDLRSPKVAEIQHHGQATWLLYDGPQRIQARLSGPTQILNQGPLVEQRWQASELSARRCYLAPQPPGQPTDHPSPNLPPEFRKQLPTEPQTQPGRKHFAVVQTVATHLDVLYLHHAGHQRAAFTFNPQATPPNASPTTATWLEV